MCCASFERLKSVVRWTLAGEQNNRPALIPAGGKLGVTSLVASPLPVEHDPFPVSIIWHSRADEDPFHKWFRDMVGEIVVALAEGAGIAKDSIS